LYKYSTVHLVEKTSLLFLDKDFYNDENDFACDSSILSEINSADLSRCTNGCDTLSESDKETDEIGPSSKRTKYSAFATLEEVNNQIVSGTETTMVVVWKS